MKYMIKIPDPCPILQLDGSPVLDEKGVPVVLAFDRFVAERTCDLSFSNGESFDMDSILTATIVTEDVRNAVLSKISFVLIDSVHYDRLRRSVLKPHSGYNPVVARCLLPFMRAVIEAKPE